MTTLKLTYYHPTSQTGCLLIHDFTGTPADLHLVGDALRGNGCSALDILLPGHGTKPEDLQFVKYGD